MKILIIIVIISLFVISTSAAYGAHDRYSQNHPCSVKVNSILFPVTYLEQIRQNPDNTFYPGDGFHYLFMYSASDTCISFVAKPVISEGAFNVLSHHRMDVRYNGENLPTHSHDNLDKIPKYLKTTNYYIKTVTDVIKHGSKGGGNNWNEEIFTLSEKPVLSIREDQTPTKSQMKIVNQYGTGYLKENIVTVDTYGWGFAKVGDDHGHEKEFHYNEDKSSIDQLYSSVSNACSNLEKYQGCIFGHVEIEPKLIEEKCLIDELNKMGIRDHGVEIETCVNISNIISLTVEGKELRCSTDGNGNQKCKTITKSRSSSAAPTILSPDFELELIPEILLDNDGVDAGNLDGTFYIKDPATIRHSPSLKWLEERGNHLSVSTSRTSDITKIFEYDCDSNNCHTILDVLDLWPQNITATNGQGITIFTTTSNVQLGNHDFKYHGKLYNLDKLVSETDSQKTILFPAYDPVMESHTYTLLKDKERNAFLDREGIALKYFGSWGNGPDDDGELHEKRRAKINDYSAYGFASFGYNIIQLNATTEWAGSETDTTTNPEPKNTFMSGFNETALFKQSGYGKVFLFSDIEHLIRNNLLTNATIYSTLKTVDFADINLKYLTAEEYRYPANKQTSSINIQTVDINGNIISDKEISISLIPNQKVGSTFLNEYIYNKVLYDTEDIGYANLISGDTHSMIMEASGKGNVTLPTAITASLFPQRGEIIEIQQYSNPDEWQLYEDYVKNSELVKWDIPIDMGLDADASYIMSITNNGKTIEQDWRYFDQHALETIYINNEQNNIIDIKRTGSTIKIPFEKYFGQISQITINDEIIDTSCNNGCILNVPRYSELNIGLENTWGGKAYAQIEQVEEIDTTPPDNLYQNAIISILILAIAFVAITKARRYFAAKDE